MAKREIQKNSLRPPKFTPKKGSLWVNILTGNVYKVIAIAKQTDRWGYSVVYSRTYYDSPEVYVKDLHNWFGEVMSYDGRPERKWVPDPSE